MTTTFVPQTLDAENFGQSFIDFKGSVSGLVASDVVLDAGLLSFEYGTDPELADAQRVSNIAEKAMLADESTTYEIRQEGLDAGIEYFFRAIIQPVVWTDENLVGAAATSVGFMNDLGANEPKLQEALSTLVSRDTIFSSPRSRALLLCADYIISALWSNTTESELFCKTSPQPIPESLASGHGDDTQLSFITNQYGGQGIQFDINEGGDSVENYIGIDLDLTDINSLIVETRISDSDYDKYDLIIKIDDTQEFSVKGIHSWTERSIDVSGYTGNHTLKLGYRESSSNNTSRELLEFGAIRAQR